MKLKVVLPGEVLLEEEVRKIVAEAVDGSFCLLDRHIDFVAPLAVGLLAFQKEEGGEDEYIAVDGGVLVKQGAEVLVATPRGVRRGALGELREEAERRFGELREHEGAARRALAQLESSLVRHLIELED